VLVFRPLERRHAPESAGLVASTGIGLILQSAAQKATNTEVHRFPDSVITSGQWTVGGIHVSSIQVLTLATAGAMAALLATFLHRTPAGARARAVAASAEVAGLLGINANLVRLGTFFIGGLFAGISGILIGTSYNSVHFMMGEPYLLIGMAVVVLGGMGSVLGAFVSGLAIGLVRELTMAYISTELADALPFVVLLTVLLVRPNGLFGTVATTGAVRAGRAS
jgi:branched-chain amino acid transport system permease protein